MNDRYEKIRKALAMVPTPGAWEQDIDGARAAYISACDPDTIRELLKERDALREALKELVNWFPSADTYLRLGFDPKAPMQALKDAKVVLSKE